MPGGVLQLSAFGAQDVYLTGTPQITFFKSVYRRYTNFATESIQQAFDGTVDFGKLPTVTISRNGDLLGAVWLEISVPDLLTYDITPTPAEGNTSNVMTVGGNVFTDTTGNYWQVRYGSAPNYTYANAIAAYDGIGSYYGRYGQLGNVASYTGNITTWPYMLVGNTSNAAIRNFTVPTSNVRYVNGIGYAIMKSVELEIGGQRIDKHYSEWWDVWTELTEKSEKLDGLNVMTGRYDPTTYASTWQRQQAAATTYYVPLRFCYNRAPGMYLPLVALSYHQIKLNFEFRNYLECVRSTVPITALTSKLGALPLSIQNVNLYADYVFLDSPERMRMSEIQHEYLVTQLQYQGDEPVPSPQDPNGTVNRKYNLNFNHPVRELVWVYQAASKYASDPVAGNDIFDYEIPGTGGEIFETAKLVINGSDRFSVRNGPYFRLVQPYEHHTRVPSKSVYVYSFALSNAEDLQPNGTANFTRFDSAQLQFSLNPALPAGRVKIYAVNYNVLRVAAGMAGLSFAN